MRRQRAALDEADDVADLGLVLLVVRVELRRAAHDLLVLGVRLGRVDADGDRLVALVGDDDAAALLAPALLASALGSRRRCRAPSWPSAPSSGASGADRACAGPGPRRPRPSASRRPRAPERPRRPAPRPRLLRGGGLLGGRAPRPRRRAPGRGAPRRPRAPRRAGSSAPRLLGSGGSSAAAASAWGSASAAASGSTAAAAPPPARRCPPRPRDSRCLPLFVTPSSSRRRARAGA